MTKYTAFIAACLMVSIGISTVDAQLYWDTNGATTGSTDTPPDAPGTWDGVTSNWSTDPNGDSATQAWIPGSEAVFSAGSDATGLFNVTISGTQSASGVTFEDGPFTTPTLIGGQLDLTGAATVNVASGSAEAHIDSVIGGTAGLTSSGPGTLFLGGANTYMGDTTLLIGNTLKLGASNVIPDTSVIQITGASSTFDLNGMTETVKSIAGGATNARIVVGTGTLTISDASGDVNTYLSQLTAVSGGKVIKNGDGTINLGASNADWDGEFVLNSGTLGYGVNNALGNTSNSSAKLTINGGVVAGSPTTATRSVQTLAVDIGGDFAFGGTGTAQMEFIGGIEVVNGINEGTVDITLKTANPTINVPNATSFLIFRGNVLDNGNNYGLTKTGAGVLTMRHPNSTYGGATTILQGQLRIDADGALGNGSGALNLSGGSLNTTASRDVVNFPVPNPVNVTADSGITTTNGAATVDLNLTSNSIGGTGGTLTLRNEAGGGTGQFEPRFSGSGFNFTRPIVIAAGSNDAARTTRLSSANATGTQTFSGVISGAGTYRRMTGGTTVFTAANSFTGGAEVEGGTLTATGSTATFGAGDVTVTGGNLEISSGVANAIADTATLSLMGGGTPGVADVAYANLGAGVNERVLALLLNGVGQANGTYGSSASAAMFQMNEYFAGMGILTVGPASLPGDYNGDGKVNAADYVTWRKNPGGFPANAYDTWRANFGNPPGSGSSLGDGAAVPEPASLILAMLAAGLALVGLNRFRVRHVG